MTNEEFARCVQEAGEKDLLNFQSRIVMLKNMRSVMKKYGLATKEAQDEKLREMRDAGLVAAPMQYCPASESPDVLFVDEKGTKFDALMLK